MNHNFVSRELMYTAVTRAKKAVTLVLSIWLQNITSRDGRRSRKDSDFSVVIMPCISFATILRFAIAGLRDGGPACALCADSDEALAVDDGALLVPEDVRSVLM